MSGLFGALHVGSSALRYGQVGMSIAAQNLANAATEGYTRRRVEGATIGDGPPGRWARTKVGLLGVQVVSTGRLSDPFAQARVRSEVTKQSFLTTRADTMSRLDAAIGEPSDTGVSAAFARFRAALSDVADKPDNGDLRAAVLATAGDLTSAVSGQVRQFDEESQVQRGKAAATVADVNDWAGELASVNKKIASARGSDIDISTLEDKRDLLAEKLAAATGGVARLNETGGFDFTVDGAALVRGTSAGSLAITTGGPDTVGEDLTVEMTDADGGVAPVDSFGGSLAANIEAVNITIPTYVQSLGELVVSVADQVNSVHSTGVDSNGDAGGEFFSYDPTDPARTFTVAISDAALLASDSSGTANDGAIARELASLTEGEDGYRKLVIGFATGVQSANRMAETQDIFTNQVVGLRDSISAVSQDEELLNLTAAQRQYEAAARVITVVDSMLDTLINRTGVTR